MYNTKFELTSPVLAVRTHTFTDPDDSGRIPDNLAAVTFTIIALHARNDDLDWLKDMIAEIPEGRD